MFSHYIFIPSFARETEEKKVLLEEMRYVSYYLSILFFCLCVCVCETQISPPILRPVFIAFSICLFVCLLFFGAEAAVQRVGGMVGKRIRE